MSTNGANETSTQPPRLTSDEADLIWQAHKAYDVREGLWTMVRMVFGLELIPAFFQGSLVRGVIVIAAQFVVLVVVREALRMTTRRLGRVWHHWLRAYAHRQRQKRVQRETQVPWRRALVLVVLLGGVLQGCADTYKSLARLYGCDPVAIDQGYCTMPKGGGKP